MLYHFHRYLSANFNTKHTSVFSARCNIYILRLCYDVSVCLSVTKVHWRIIANLGFKFRSKFTAHCGRGAYARCMRAQGEGSSLGRVEESSCAMLATARPSCSVTALMLLHADRKGGYFVAFKRLCSNSQRFTAGFSTLPGITLEK